MSDLDGTMVSDDAESDAAMRDFAHYWETNAALCDSILVYNTGRSLGQFTHLLQEKGRALALPDVVITAVGTKVISQLLVLVSCLTVCSCRFFT